MEKFPSPHGDKFQLLRSSRPLVHSLRFRPLTGINFNYLRAHNTNLYVAVFPSPHGDKFQHERVPAGVQACGFRPLTGINFNCSVCIRNPFLKVSVPSRG